MYRGRRARRPAAEPWLYLAPALVWLAAFAIFPLVYTVNLSLRHLADPAQPMVGLRHYVELFNDPALLGSLRATAIFSVGTLSLSFVLGFAIALLLASEDLYGQAFFRTLIILPYLISPIVIGVAFRLMLHPILGVVNYVLGTRGVNWLGGANTAMLSVILITTWELTPFFALILLAGLLALPQEPYDAARVDGATRWQLFRYLTFPLLRPVSMLVLLIGVIDVLKVFAIIFASTEGGPARLTEVIGLYIYRTGFRFYRLDYASALAVVLVVGIAGIAFLTMRALGERTRGEAS